MRRNHIPVSLLIFVILVSLAGCSTNTVQNESADKSSAATAEKSSVITSQNPQQQQSADRGYGASFAAQDNDLTLDEMLSYSLQDEYLARGEYQKVIDTLGDVRPFINIIKAEQVHIDLLKPLLEKYKVKLPEDRSKELTKVPSSFEEALRIGAEAEVSNIAMYNKFLEQSIPDDVKEVFVILRDGSESHLQAFSGSGGNGSGKGLQKGKN